MKKALPNFITVLNLFTGCIAIVQAFESQIYNAAYLIFVAALLDFLDGFMARILNAKSELGKMLDSLADIVSFGVVPAILFYQMMIMSLTINDARFNYETADFFENIIMYSSFLIAAFAMIRLAKFSIDDSQKHSFTGLPVPATAIFAAGYFLSVYHTPNQALRLIMLRTDLLLILIILISVLMVSRIKMFALKFEDYSFSGNRIKYLFLFVSFVSLLIFNLYALPYIIIGYILVSLISQVNPFRN